MIKTRPKRTYRCNSCTHFSTMPSLPTLTPLPHITLLFPICFFVSFTSIASIASIASFIFFLFLQPGPLLNIKITPLGPTMMHIKKNPKNPKKNEDNLPTNSVVCFCEVVFLHILGSQDFLVFTSSRQFWP